MKLKVCVRFHNFYVDIVKKKNELKNKYVTTLPNIHSIFGGD